MCLLDYEERGMSVLSTLIVCYLFLGGAGAGAFFWLAILSFLSPRSARLDSACRRFFPRTLYRRLFAPSFLVCLATLVLGALCLAVDLGRFDRILLLFTHPTLSYLSIGTFALTLLIICTVFLTVVWLFDAPFVHKVVVRIVEVVGFILSGFVMVYTGLLLQSIGTALFWGSPFVPTIFVLSSLSTGIALILGSMFFTGIDRSFRTIFVRLIRVDALVIVAEMLCAGVLVVCAAGDAGYMRAVYDLVQGAYATIFWVGFVLCGLAVPFVAEVLFIRRDRRSAAIFVAVLVLVGGFCLRWCVVGAGSPVETVAHVMLVL